MEKFLLFSTGEGGQDTLSWNAGFAIALKASSLKEMKPVNNTLLDLVFNEDGKVTVVSLEIKNGSHLDIMNNIAASLGKDLYAINIANVDAGEFVHKSINSVKIKEEIMLKNEQKIII